MRLWLALDFKEWHAREWKLGAAPKRANKSSGNEDGSTFAAPPSTSNFLEQPPKKFLKTNTVCISEILSPYTITSLWYNRWNGQIHSEAGSTKRLVELCHHYRNSMEWLWIVQREEAIDLPGVDLLTEGFVFHLDSNVCNTEAVELLQDPTRNPSTRAKSFPSWPPKETGPLWIERGLAVTLIFGAFWNLEHDDKIYPSHRRSACWNSS